MNRNIHYIYIIALLLLMGAVMPLHAQIIKGKIYGGGELATVNGDAKVEVLTGTVGDGNAFDGGVFGGGLGEPTIVTGNVEVLIGEEGSAIDAAGPTINGDVYGGSALGNTNCSADGHKTPTVVDPETSKLAETSVTLNAGTINGSMYGGALGQKNGVGGATSDIAANVYGPVQVSQNGGNVWNTDGSGNNGSGGIYGCNNLNGEPKNTVKVDIYRTNSHNNNSTADDYTDDKYAVFAVYGGGNQASYSIGTPVVTVHGCDNSIEYVYGGGNAAHLTHATNGNTDVTIWGCELIGNVFGGGNGQVQAANVSGNTQVTIHGGTIENVYGGSNTNGMIGGVTNVDVLAQGEVDPSDVCLMALTNVYGGGNKAAGKSGMVNIACTGDEGYIANVYGGANMADLTGDITLNILGGNIGKAFGGNNNSGNIDGAITVNINWATGPEACAKNSLTNVYGGGNLAPYTTPAEKEGPTVNLINGTVSGYVYGGGLGEAAVVTGNPVVNLIGATVTNDIFGGGDEAPVTGNPLVNAEYGSVNDIFAGGRGSTAIVTGNPKAYINQASDSEGTLLALTINDVYGGGDAANVNGTAKVEMVAGTIGIWNDGVCTSGGDIYGGGNAADVTNTDVLISGGTTNRVFGGGHGNKGTGVDDPERAAANVAKDSEGNGGNAVVKVEGGTITQVFAAGNSLGAVEGQSTLTIEKKQLGDDATDDEIAALPKLKVEEAYGGGNEADGNAGTVIVGCTGGNEEYVKDVYGGARDAIVTSDITLTIKGGNIDRVFGGNNVNGNVQGAIEVNIDEEDGSCGLSLNNVYGGGNQAGYDPTEDTDSITVNIKNGTVKENVYGGGLGESAVVKSNPAVNLIGGDVLGYAFGGGEQAPVEGNPAVTLMGSTIGTWDGEGNLTSGGDVFAGGNLATVTGNPMVTVTEGKANDIFAGGKGKPAVVTGNTLAYVNLTDGKELTIRDIYGGGDAANVSGKAGAKVDKGTVRNVYGGGNAADVDSTDVIINGGNTQLVFGGGHGNKDASPATEANVTIAANVTVHGGTIGKVFAGTNSKGTNGSQTVTIQKDDELAKDELHITEVYGGGNLAEGIAGKIHVLCTGSETEGIIALYGGANEANVTTQINLTIEGGKIGTVYGGNNTSGSIVGDITVTIDQTSDCGTVALGDVFGGGNKANFGQNTTVNVIKGTVTGDVYGGGALANVTGNTAVNLTGGVVGGAYGGGLGQLAADAVGTEGQPGYQPAKEAVEAIVGGNTTVTLNGSQVTGEGIFGANNVNGTPKGHVKVHVLSTTPRDGQAVGEYDVPAVYGGGNKAAYEPTDGNDFAEVRIENCGNSIEYVYGGGNAAPVPATSVTIYGANAIDNAFAGGNGHGAGNPGADIGYLEYTRDDQEKEYGTGIARINVYGGTVNNVYGGSNTLGYIRTHTYVTVDEVPDDYEGDLCDLKVGNVHGGGNEAEMLCGGTVTLGCTEGAEIVYAGANKAHIHGNIDLTISSGTYGKVFGGNNIGGNVYGAIKITIDETGCYPVMIGELYGAGCKAPYSVYGYEDEGVKAPKTSGDKLYGNGPEINIVSCTRIAKIFGGGWGETATVYGSPTININTIKGIYAGEKTTPFFVLNSEEDGRVENTEEIVIPDLVGLIGTIYGGGNAASVYGDTNINIGTKLTGSHVSGSDELKAEVQDINVRIEGNVYGGSKGKLGNPYAAKVTGNTSVNVGKE